MSSSEEEHPHLHHRQNLHVATDEDCEKHKDGRSTMGRHVEETYSMQTSSNTTPGRKAVFAKSSPKEENLVLVTPKELQASTPLVAFTGERMLRAHRRYPPEA